MVIASPLGLPAEPPRGKCPPSWRRTDRVNAPPLRSARPEQAVLHREQSGAGPGSDAGLGVDALEMMTHRLGGDTELGGSRFVRLAPGDEPQHVDLALGEPGGAVDRRTSTTPGMTRGVEDRVDIGA